MTNILAFTKEGKVLPGVAIDGIDAPEVSWYWVDIVQPEDCDVTLLTDHFHFHHLAVEDCLHYSERPKVDYYDHYNYFVLSVLNPKTLRGVDLDLFVGKNYLVTFHKEEMGEVTQVRERLMEDEAACAQGYLHAVYSIFDKIVDAYFPAAYRIEDDLGCIVIRAGENVSTGVMNRVFDLRDDLLRLRRTVNSMKELLYRIISSEHLQELRGKGHYFGDIYDHLLKLSDMIESNREMTADMRDSYLSINTNRMNRIMTILTVVSAIFIPLTFIVGVYGMNFANMPELRWENGYYITLGVMAAIGIGMFLWFRLRGWLDINK